MNLEKLIARNVAVAKIGTLQLATCVAVVLVWLIEVHPARIIVNILSFGEALVYFFGQVSAEWTLPSIFTTYTFSPHKIELILGIRKILPAKRKAPYKNTFNLAALWAIAYVSFIIFVNYFIYITSLDYLLPSILSKSSLEHLENKDQRLRFHNWAMIAEAVLMLAILVMYAFIYNQIGEFQEQQDYREWWAGEQEHTVHPVELEDLVWFCCQSIAMSHHYTTENKYYWKLSASFECNKFQMRTTKWEAKHFFSNFQLVFYVISWFSL